MDFWSVIQKMWCRKKGGGRKSHEQEIYPTISTRKNCKLSRNFELEKNLTFRNCRNFCQCSQSTKSCNFGVTIGPAETVRKCVHGSTDSGLALSSSIFVPLSVSFAVFSWDFLGQCREWRETVVWLSSFVRCFLVSSLLRAVGEAMQDFCLGTFIAKTIEWKFEKFLPLTVLRAFSCSILFALCLGYNDQLLCFTRAHIKNRANLNLTLLSFHKNNYALRPDFQSKSFPPTGWKLEKPYICTFQNIFRIFVYFVCASYFVRFQQA